MANVKMPKFKAAQERAETPDLSDAGTNIKAVLVDTSLYIFDATDEFLADVDAGARVATSGNLANKTVSATDGTFGADPITFSAVDGASVEALYLFHDTGVEGTSRLIAYVDSAGGIPVTPNSTDITVSWHASGIYTP
jgi:hypothetical protein